MQNSNHKTELQPDTGIPRTLECRDPLVRQELLRDFQQAYTAVATYWEGKLPTVPRTLPREHHIVQCFMQEWVSIHVSALELSRCGDDKSALLAASDPVVREFIKVWEEKHTPILEERERNKRK